MRFGESTISPLTRQFSERLGVDWKRRARLLIGRHARLSELTIHDERMALQVEGLRCLGKPGMEGVQARLKEEIVPRDLFSLAVQSCVTSDTDCFAACVALAEAMPHLQSAFLAAMEWVEPVLLCELMKDWRTNSELYRLTKLQLLVDTRFDGLSDFSSVIAEVQTQAEQRLLLRAARLRASPDWVQIPLEENITKLLDGGFQWEVCAHHLLFGDASKREQLLEHACEHIQQSQEKDIEWWITLLASEPTQCGEQIVQTLLKHIGKGRCYIIALGWLGKTQYIPELIDFLDDPSLARIAANTISMLTGSMPERDGWQQTVTNAVSTDKDSKADKTDKADNADNADKDDNADKADKTADKINKIVDKIDKKKTEEQYDFDSHLPWPDKKCFLAWWDKHHQEFDASARYLLGRKREPRELIDLLKQTSLTWRPAAAWMLQRQKQEMALDTDAAAFRQITNLAHFEQLVESIV